MNIFSIFKTSDPKEIKPVVADVSASVLRAASRPSGLNLFSLRELASEMKLKTGAHIEIVGTWLWISFNVRPNSEARTYLKAKGCRWNKTRNLWQFSNGHRTRRSPLQNGALRAQYGSIEVETEKVA